MDWFWIFFTRFFDFWAITDYFPSIISRPKLLSLKIDSQQAELFLKLIVRQEVFGVLIWAEYIFKMLLWIFELFPDMNVCELSY